MKIALVGVLGIFLTAGQLFAAEEAEPTLTRSYPVAPGGELTVDVEQGDIQVTAGTENKVEIVVERQAVGVPADKQAGILKRHKVTFSQNGDNVHVEAGMAKSRNPFSHAQPQLSVHFRIKVPPRYNVMLTTSGGSIDISNLRGTADAHSAGGDLNFTNIDGTVDAQTSGGSVRVDGCTDTMKAQTSGGNILLKNLTGTSVTADTMGGNVDVLGCEGNLQVKSSGGNITISNFSGSNMYVDTSGGSISFDMMKQPTAASWVHTSGGNITAKLAEGIGVKLVATTQGGNINSAIPVIPNVPGQAKQGELEGKIGPGGPLLTLRTSAGNIQILKL